VADGPEAEPDRSELLLRAELDALRLRERQLQNELRLRVRNLLATVRSVFQRTVETGAGIEEVELHFNGRLDVIARHQPGFDAPCDLERLIRDELRSFDFGYVDAITIDGADTALAPDQVLPVAMALHELVTNALKFGALSREGGRLAVSWRSEGGSTVLEWRESGVPVIGAAPHRRGFGRRYIEDALPYQVGADTSFGLEPGGVRCTIRLPAGDKAKLEAYRSG
jgi:two-component sensor histidine kinase